MLDTEAVIKGVFHAAGTGDLDEVLRWWADDGILEDVTIAKAYVGKEELRPYLDMYFRAFPDLRFEPLRVLISEQDAMVEWAKSTRFVGEFDGLFGDGREIFLHAVDVFHIEDGLIRHECSWYGDGWLRNRLETIDPGTVPPTLPVTRPS